VASNQGLSDGLKTERPVSHCQNQTYENDRDPLYVDSTKYVSLMLLIFWISIYVTIYLEIHKTINPLVTLDVRYGERLNFDVNHSLYRSPKG
jgi:hypothetical protein